MFIFQPGKNADVWSYLNWQLHGFPWVTAGLEA